MVGVLGPDSDNDDDTYPLAGLSTQIGTSGQFEVVIDLDVSIDTDKLLLAVSDSVANLAGHRLDGQWQDAASTHPPGNESHEGDCRFRFNALPGDITQNGIVASSGLSPLLSSTMTQDNILID